MSIRKDLFGTMPDGLEVFIFTLENSQGSYARVMTYGATLVSLVVPDKNSRRSEITLGFDKFDDYLTKNIPYLGVVVGRVANRIENARFTLNGKHYSLAANNGPNHLHGGLKGFDKVVWSADVTDAHEGDAITFSYLSPDGEEGYPGTMECSVTYILTEQNELILVYSATTDAPTPVNLTNHAYFNLAGTMSDTILDHMMLINADSYTPSDELLIPTGTIETVKGTALDFRTPRAIGSRIHQLSGSYDHNYILNKEDDELSLAARVSDPASGRVMEVWTTEPGVQFYSGNFLVNLAGRGNSIYNKHAGFCLETQHFPDAVNKPQFPSIILQPGEMYSHLTRFSFGTE